jgi:hypothetical protein
VALPIVGGNAGYLAWIDAETGAEPPTASRPGRT